MSNTNSDTDFIQIVHADVTVDDQSIAAQSKTSIGTSALGPCVCFIIDFIFKNEQRCILHHYAFHEDEAKQSQEQTIKWLLKFLFDLFEDFLGIKSTIDEFNEPYIKNMFLLITGGDLHEGINIKPV